MSSPVRLLSVGHSSRTLDELCSLLVEHRVRHVADVRRHPASRRYPWFSEGPLREALRILSIGYTHLPSLGGFRDAPPGFERRCGLAPEWRGYAAHMETDEFRDAVSGLLSLAERRDPLAFLCAEREPGHCHRRLLSDALSLAGARVGHVIARGEVAPHAVDPLAVLESDGVVRYPPAQASLF